MQQRQTTLVVTSLAGAEVEAAAAAGEATEAAALEELGELPREAAALERLPALLRVVRVVAAVIPLAELCARAN